MGVAPTCNTGSFVAIAVGGWPVSSEEQPQNCNIGAVVVAEPGGSE